MILERALVLLFASISAVAGFSPCGHSTFPLSLASSYASRAAFSPSVRVASTIFSEAESSETVVSEVPAFETAIYVGNISFGTLESDIRTAFAAHGSVSKVSIPMDGATGRSRGFAFVSMANAEDHATAIAALNESELDGRTIYVSESVPKEKVTGTRTSARDTPRRSSPRGTKLYVGNLNFSTTVEELQKVFAEYGEVKDVYLPSDYDGNPRGFAFVQMEEENALKAIDGLNGLELGGRTLNVKKSLPKVTSNSR